MTPKHQTQTDKTHKQQTENTSNLLLVGEGLHVLNPAVYESIERHQPEELIRFAQKRVEAGAQALAVNLGPGKNMLQQMPWVIDTIRAEITVPLFLSAGVINSQKTLQRHGSHIVINAVTANPETLSQHVQVAKAYDTGLVVLLVRPGLTPTGVNDRINLALEVVETATKAGLPLDRLYLDPVLGSRPDPFALDVSKGFPDIGTITETIALIQELNCSVRTIIGLGNGSVGLTGEKRSSLHCRMLPLLASGGLDAAILNCLDNHLMNVAADINSIPADHQLYPDQPILAPAA